MTSTARWAKLGLQRAQKQPAVDVVRVSDINWSSQPAALHRKHGDNIRLSENITVAERINPHQGDGNWDSAVVMTAEPVTVGEMFQVTVLEKAEGWAGSLVSVVMDLRGEHLPLV